MRTISIILAGILFLSSCASTTLIQSNPNGAKVYIDGEAVGQTPYSHSDTKIVGSCMNVRLEKEGHETLNTTICRNEEADVGAIVGGFFVLVPFLWTMKYKPTHSYELSPSLDTEPEVKNESVTEKSKAERLRELKKLFDEGILTKEEFEKEKKKILEEE